MGVTPPKPVVDLVARCEPHERLQGRNTRDRKVFQSPDYKEEQLRLEFGQRTCRLRFLNPLFESLGWDVNNKQGLSETFKQVIHEASIKVAGATKAQDRTFRIGGRWGSATVLLSD